MAVVSTYRSNKQQRPMRYLRIHIYFIFHRLLQWITHVRTAVEFRWKFASFWLILAFLTHVQLFLLLICSVLFL
ncbi:hypothetical protein PFLUV_G00052480, partial [Perca fluviatilis]